MKAWIGGSAVDVLPLVLLRHYTQSLYNCYLSLLHIIAWIIIIIIVIYNSFIGRHGPIHHPDIFIFPFPTKDRLPISPERGLFFDHSQILLPRYDYSKNRAHMNVYNNRSGSNGSGEGSDSYDVNEGVVPLTLHPCKEGLYLHPDHVLDMMVKKCHYDYAKVLTIDPITGSYT